MDIIFLAWKKKGAGAIQGLLGVGVESLLVFSASGAERISAERAEAQWGLEFKNLVFSGKVSGAINELCLNEKKWDEIARWIEMQETCAAEGKLHGGMQNASLRLQKFPQAD